MDLSLYVIDSGELIVIKNALLYLWPSHPSWVRVLSTTARKQGSSTRAVGTGHRWVAKGYLPWVAGVVCRCSDEARELLQSG